MLKICAGLITVWYFVQRFETAMAAGATAVADLAAKLELHAQRLELQLQQRDERHASATDAIAGLRAVQGDHGHMLAGILERREFARDLVHELIDQSVIERRRAQ